MASWESLVRISAAGGWNTAGTYGSRGIFLYADSVNPDLGAQAKERDAKLLGVREIPPETFSIDRFQPKLSMTIQPRVDDILMLLMAHFQTCAKSGIGTYQFYRIPFNPDWSTVTTASGTYNSGTNGTAPTGTNVYSIHTDVCYGYSFAGTGANGYRFTNCIVDKLTMDLKYGEDFTINCDLKPLNGTEFVYPSTFLPLSAFGSFSAYGRLVDSQGTVTLIGKSYDMQSWQGNFNNNSVDRAKLGQRGFGRFPFAGRYVADGSFDTELQDGLTEQCAGSFGSLSVSLCSVVGTNQINIVNSNIGYKPWAINIANGNSILEYPHPYRAFPPSGTTGPSVIVTVYTGTNFGTTLIGF
jgi:hypothetical protein